MAVARRGEAPTGQIAKDFGISESCLRNWLRVADVQDGARPGVTASESAELRELRRRNRLLEQENEVLLRRAIADQGVGESEAASLAMLVVAGMEGALLLALTARDPAPLHTVAAELADVLRLRTTQDGAGRATR
ncbi:MAG: putative transposase [Pseudonocardiales bacterium]|nr:putative transposase [Pseudonocardiales bacterium]